MHILNEAIWSTHYIGRSNGRAALESLVCMAGIIVIAVTKLQLEEVNYRRIFSMGTSTTETAPYIPRALALSLNVLEAV
jgi:hypothetical protein